MARKQQGGYQLFVQTPLRKFGQVVGWIWIKRSGVTDLEMARALTGDLGVLGVRWEIRDSISGQVIESSSSVKSNEENNNARTGVQS